jgi:hypothetical protein
MSISANTLFHFTQKENLISILTSNFSPKYSLEDLSNATPRISIYKEAYIPMVCFCDLLFSQIKDHIDFYGDYGIGLRKKEWGIKKGISPIVYVAPESNSAIQIQGIATIIGSRLKSSSDRNVIRKQLQNFYKFVKPYSGDIVNRKNHRKENKVFYNEREWRYVPTDFQVLPKKKTSKKALDNRNASMQEADKLTFDAKDIKYIIVKRENEIPEFADFIESQLTQFSESDRKILVSKLISVEQIKDDM